MTTYEHFMMSVVFGATVGLLIGLWVINIKLFIEGRKEKHKLKKEKKEFDTKLNQDNGE